MLNGQIVAQGVVEEKSSRVVELLLATIRPWQLMAGKVAGIGVTADRGTRAAVRIGWVDSIVISRKQVATAFSQRIAVRTPDGENLVGTFTLRAGLRNGIAVRLPKEQLDEQISGDHDWPDEGIMIRIRMPNWWLRNFVVALFALAGLIGGAAPYSGLLVLVWGVIALCARHNRLHAVDRFDPATRRFWNLFRNTLASTAIVYLAAISAVIALYLTVAMVFKFVQGALTVAQLVGTQRALSTASEFYDNWIKLKEGPMFLAL